MKTDTRRSGQTMVEYIIIVVVIAIAALAVFGYFGGAVQEKVAGATSSIDSGSHASDAQGAVQDTTSDSLKTLDKTGIK